MSATRFLSTNALRDRPRHAWGGLAWFPCNARRSAATYRAMGCLPSQDVVTALTALSNEDEHALCERFAGRIHAYGLRHLRDGSRAQDLVQHVLLAVLQALRAGNVDDPTRLDAYVLGTCRNAVMDMRRGDVRQRRLAEQSSAGSPQS